MADNTVIPAGAGGDTIASDDITGVKFQRVKLSLGEDGVWDGDVSSINPMPVTGIYVEDEVSAGGEALMLAGAVRRDNLGGGSLQDFDGDYSGLYTNEVGRLHTSAQLRFGADEAQLLGVDMYNSSGAVAPFPVMLGNYRGGGDIIVPGDGVSIVNGGVRGLGCTNLVSIGNTFGAHLFAEKSTDGVNFVPMLMYPLDGGPAISEGMTQGWYWCEPGTFVAYIRQVDDGVTHGGIGIISYTTSLGRVQRVQGIDVYTTERPSHLAEGDVASLTQTLDNRLRVDSRPADPQSEQYYRRAQEVALLTEMATHNANVRLNERYSADRRGFELR
jgi:hypothetical protein